MWYLVAWYEYIGPYILEEPASTPKTDAAGSSKTVISTYKATWHHVPEVHDHHIHCHLKLRSHVG